jgi:hypothetical protein
MPVLATTVYKTVDQYGVVSFTDIRPNSAGPVETLVIDVRQPQLNDTDQQRLSALRETTDRMAADRREREKHRAEMRQQTISRQPQYAAAPYYQPTSFVGYSSSARFSRRGYNRHRPGHTIGRPPQHPGVHPPMRPPQHQRPAQPRQFSVNDYPASLVRRHYSSHAQAAFGYR